MTIGDLELNMDGDVVTAQLRGEIDMSNAGDVVSSITHATPNEACGVALDLSGVDYLDSAGIHMLYRLRESLQTRGQLLRLVIPPGSAVLAALRLAGIEDQVNVFEALDGAVRDLRRAEGGRSET